MEGTAGNTGLFVRLHLLVIDIKLSYCTGMFLKFIQSGVLLNPEFISLAVNSPAPPS